MLALAAGLRARGWRFVVAGPRDGVLFERFVPVAESVVETRTDRLHPATVLKLVRLIRRHGVGLVHSHGKGAGLHARLAARITGVPAVHTLTGCTTSSTGHSAAQRTWAWSDAWPAGRA